MRVALDELGTGDTPLDDVLNPLLHHVLALTDLGDLFGREPLRQERVLLEVHRPLLAIRENERQHAARALVQRFTRRPSRVVLQAGQRLLGSLEVDLIQDECLGGEVVIHRRLVQARDISDVVHPGAVIAPRGEQFGSHRHQFLAAAGTALRGIACLRGSGDRLHGASLYAQAFHAWTKSRSTGWIIRPLCSPAPTPEAR